MEIWGSSSVLSDEIFEDWYEIISEIWKEKKLNVLKILKVMEYLRNLKNIRKFKRFGKLPLSWREIVSF
jgi:hypothetical protein